MNRRAVSIAFRTASLALIAVLLGCEHIPKAELHGIRMKSFEPDLAVPSLDVAFDLLLRVENPFDVTIPVPAHHYRLELGPGPIVPVSGTLPAFSLVPGSNLLRYPIALHLDPAGELASLLGTDAAFAFVTEIRVALPNGEEWTAPLRMAGEMRLGLPPEWSLDPQSPPTARPLGTVEQIDLGVLHELIVAVGDPVVASTGDDYQKAQWRKFKQSSKVLVPSSFDGVEVAVPVIVRNPNSFAIAPPSIDTELRVGTPRRPLVAVKLAGGGAQDLAAGAEREMTLSGRVRWAALGEGIGALLSTGTTGADARGTLRIDFGYGVTEVPVGAGFELTVGQ